MDRKFELTSTTKKLQNGEVVYQIKALKDINNPSLRIKKGDLGGWVQDESNLSHKGTCWITPSTYVLGKSKILGDSLLNRGNIIVINSIISAKFMPQPTMKDTNTINFINSHIVGKFSFSGNIYVEGSTIKNTTISNPYIFGIDERVSVCINTNITDSIMYNCCLVRDSTIQSSYLENNSRVANSRIISSMLDYSYISQKSNISYSDLIDIRVVETDITQSELYYFPGSMYQGKFNKDSSYHLYHNKDKDIILYPGKKGHMVYFDDDIYEATEFVFTKDFYQLMKSIDIMYGLPDIPEEDPDFEEENDNENNDMSTDKQSGTEII